MMAFVDTAGEVNFTALKDAVCLAVRIGLRQTNVTLDLMEWDKIQKRDRLVGVSLGGVMDFVDATSITTEDFHILLQALRLEANEEARQYAKEMRVPEPLLVTTQKPSGTISKMPGISSGVHRARAPYYIRRVRINASDPLARVMLDAGYPIYPENNSSGSTVEEYQLMTSWDKWEILNKSNTWVVEFPMQSTTKVGIDDEDAISQLQRYLDFQEYWTDHNTSITINFTKNEVEELVDMLLENWDNYVAVSFLPKNTTAYPLLPEEPITQREYLDRAAAVSHINEQYITKMLQEYEHNNMADENLDADCANGACPVR